MNRIDAGRPDIRKLRQYGFSGDNGVLRYSETLGCGFTLTFEVRDGELFTSVYDDGEEYVLHLTDASGEFVGRVRKEYEDAVSRVTSACFERAVYSPYFRSGQTARLIADAEKIWGEMPEFLWEDSPDCCILRNRESGKWYAVFMVVPLAKFLQGTGREDRGREPARGRGGDERRRTRFSGVPYEQEELDKRPCRPREGL